MVLRFAMRGMSPPSRFRKPTVYSVGLYHTRRIKVRLQCMPMHTHAGLYYVKLEG